MKKNPWRILLPALIAAPIAWAAAPPASTGNPSVAETAPANCAQCHQAIYAHKHVHGPVGVGMCSVCHVKEQKDASGKHRFELAQKQPELCLACHDAMREKALSSKVPHKAISAGGCTACHDPHGSEQRYQLKGKSMDETCSACHEPKLRGAVVHPPAKASCAVCHDPHGSDKPRLMKAEPPGLCLDCHQKAKPLFSGRHVHGPVQAGCPVCHNPHSAPKRFLLQADAKKELCLSCHEDIAQKIQNAKKPHAAIQEAGCTGCHLPHASAQARLLKQPLQQLCVSCHPAKNPELKSRDLHGPVRRGQCQDCHDPHGSDNAKILKISFPEKFYNSYQDGLYALCFNCHEKDIARDAKTTKLTSFRNGDKNLHYVHVHSEKGRSCKACHAVHGGNQDMHIREGVPFGTWMLPIRYTKTANGGTCIVGCHNPRSYDRLNPVENP